MNKVKISFDSISGYNSKPRDNDVAEISNRIAQLVKHLDSTNIKEYIDYISTDGHTFCPATFRGSKRNKESFEQQQFFTLDFDNKDTSKTISFEEVKARAEHYELPILFAYDTLSSKNHDKFRVVFLNDVSVPDKKVAEATQLAIGTIFSEADASCYKDISKMYYGGKQLLHYNSKIPEINIESVFRNLSYYFKDKYKANHYKERIAKFSKETGIALIQLPCTEVQGLL